MTPATSVMFEFTEDPTPHVSHRPWPLPAARWVMAQRWSNLLFAHWPVSPVIVRALVPAPLDIDLHQDSAWISVTPFYLSHLRPRGIPALPWISEFPELNVRTYVTHDGRPGVYFFSLDAGSVLAVEGGRRLYHLPYFAATMSVARSRDGSVYYQSRRTTPNGPAAEFQARYRSTGQGTTSAAGSIDRWLTERYCLYSVDSGQRLYRTEIHHRPWQLEPAEAGIVRNTMITAAGLTIGEQAPRLGFSRRLDVIIWPPEQVST